MSKSSGNPLASIPAQVDGYRVDAIHLSPERPMPHVGIQRQWIRGKFRALALGRDHVQRDFASTLIKAATPR